MSRFDGVLAGDSADPCHSETEQALEDSRLVEQREGDMQKAHSTQVNSPNVPVAGRLDPIQEVCDFFSLM